MKTRGGRTQSNPQLTGQNDMKEARTIGGLELLPAAPTEFVARIQWGTALCAEPGPLGCRSWLWSRLRWRRVNGLRRLIGGLRWRSIICGLRRRRSICGLRWRRVCRLRRLIGGLRRRIGGRRPGIPHRPADQVHPLLRITHTLERIHLPRSDLDGGQQPLVDIGDIPQGKLHPLLLSPPQPIDGVLEPARREDEPLVREYQLAAYVAECALGPRYGEPPRLLDQGLPRLQSIHL